MVRIIISDLPQTKEFSGILPDTAQTMTPVYPICTNKETICYKKFSVYSIIIELTVRVFEELEQED